MAARKVILKSIVGGKGQTVPAVEQRFLAMEAYGWADLWHLANGGDPEDETSMEKHALDAFKVIRAARAGSEPDFIDEIRPDIDTIETDFLSIILLFGDSVPKMLAALLTIHGIPDRFHGGGPRRKD